MPVNLPLSSITKFIDQSFTTSRLLLEGEAVYESKHVVACNVKEKKDATITFAGLVLQTSALNKDPHELEISVKDREVIVATCSCKAGLHKCKHMVALLLHINARDTFDILSSTDLPQLWGKELKAGVKDKYVPRKIVDLPCSKKVKRDHVKLPTDDTLNRLLHALPYSSTAFRHSESRNPTHPADVASSSSSSGKQDCRAADAANTTPMPTEHSACGEILEHNKEESCEATPPALTEAVIKAVEAGALSTEDIYIQLQQTFTQSNIQIITHLTEQQVNSQHWMLYRKGLITASIAYSVYTRVHTLKTKMGPHDVRPLLKSVMREQTVQTPAMSRGSLLENTAKDFYLATTTHQNLQLQSIGLVISKENPCIGASPDGLVTCSCCATRVLEVKCPVNLERFQAKELTTLSNGKLSLKKTSRYFCQIQVQMGILEVEMADFFVFQDSENVLLLTANFDRDFFSAVVERAVYFFKSYVLPYVTP
ncbi:uncharacterized protein [Dermacentor andersoni]|uniref:uncharacterized protein n=1 Tax=Dermacentor andersoni TaxID=34620 RepID=UPI003B3A2788